MGRKKAVIAYCSPSGTTRHVAQVIEKALDDTDVFTLNIGKEDAEKVLSIIQDSGETTCLYIGSPVYVSHPVPPVMDFISKLPENTGISAVPFVTWGGASSGIALHDMGKALKNKGIRLLGAAKVLALHCMMWQFENPLGQGHPDAEDDQMIQNLVAGVVKKLSENSKDEISLSDLSYFPPEIHAEMEKASLEMAKAHMPEKKLNEILCTQCGICGDVCPVNAIEFSPYPEFSQSCICCFSCVRDCPENAIQADLSIMDGRIRARAKQFQERPFTKIFL